MTSVVQIRYSPYLRGRFCCVTFGCLAFQLLKLPATIKNKLRLRSDAILYRVTRYVGPCTITLSTFLLHSP